MWYPKNILVVYELEIYSQSVMYELGTGLFKQGIRAYMLGAHALSSDGGPSFRVWHLDALTKADMQTVIKVLKKAGIECPPIN